MSNKDCFLFSLCTKTYNLLILGDMWSHPLFQRYICGVAWFSAWCQSIQKFATVSVSRAWLISRWHPSPWGFSISTSKVYIYPLHNSSGFCVRTLFLLIKVIPFCVFAIVFTIANNVLQYTKIKKQYLQFSSQTMIIWWFRIDTIIYFFWQVVAVTVP